MPSSRPTGRPVPLRWLAIATATTAALCSPGARAQDSGRSADTGAGPGRVRELGLAIAASETWLSSVRAGGSRVDEAVTEITPSLRWSSYSGRVRGNLNYGLSLRHFAGDNASRSDRNTVDQNLSADVRAELIDNAAFVDVNATIGQQSIAGVELPSSGSFSRAGNNRSEVSNVSVSPYLIGSIAGRARYELRYTFNASDGSNDAFSNRSSQAVSLAVRSQASGPLSWGLLANSSRSDFGDRGENRGERVIADLGYVPDVDWRLGISGGQERTDVGTLAARTYDNWGASASWIPSARTRVDAAVDRRYFGNGHRLNFEYRTARTVWRYSDVRDVNNGNQPGGVGQPLSLFQLYFAQFASIQPDPALREQLVLQFLSSIGRSPNEVPFLDAINRGVTVQRRRDLSAAWQGLRTSVSIQAFSTHSELLAGPNTGTPTGAGETQRQNGVNVFASHRLTPQTALSAGASLSRSPASSGQKSEAKTASLALSSELGRRTSGALSARYSVLNGAVEAYREAAVTASISLRF